MTKTQRGLTLLEVMVSMGVVMVGMLGMFKVLGTSIQGSASAQRFTQAQARMQQVHEAIRLAPAPVLACLAATPATGWALCETQCKNLLGPTASIESCVFYTLANSNQQTDRTAQLYGVIVDPGDPTRTTRVLAAGVSGRVFDVMVTVGWNDDGTVSVPPDHRVTVRSALFQ